MEKKGSAIRYKVAASAMYTKVRSTARSIADELNFQASELKRNTEPLRIEFRLMALEHMEVIRRHSQPIADALGAAVKAQIRATRERHGRKSQE